MFIGMNHNDIAVLYMPYTAMNWWNTGVFFSELHLKANKLVSFSKKYPDGFWIWLITAESYCIAKLHQYYRDDYWLSTFGL